MYGAEIFVRCVLCRSHINMVQRCLYGVYCVGLTYIWCRDICTACIVQVSHTYGAEILVRCVLCRSHTHAVQTYMYGVYCVVLISGADIQFMYAF